MLYFLTENLLTTTKFYDRLKFGGGGAIAPIPPLPQSHQTTIYDTCFALENWRTSCQFNLAREVKELQNN